MTPRINIQDDPLFQQLIIEKNLKTESIRSYKKALQLYCQYHQMTLTELYTEADTEEEQGIRAKNRKLVKRLRGFRTHLIQENYAPTSITNYYAYIKSTYRHFLIEIPYIPPVKLTPKQEMYDDIPHKEHIIECLQHTNNLKYRAIIYFMASSGTARQEICNITIQDFIDATKDYHHNSNIHDVITELEKQDNVIPVFKMIRQKTQYSYYTMITPEATQHLIRYLKTRPLKKLRSTQTLFDVNTHSITVFFIRLNHNCNYPDGFLHPHALRKYHADIIDDKSLTNMLQGRKPDAISESYFKANPKRIKEKYMKHIEDLTLQPTRLVTIESDEVKSLKAQLHREKTQRQNLEQQVLDIQSQLHDFQQMLNQFKQQK